MDRVTAFFDMGGYAWFVWPAFALTAIVLVGLALASGRALKSREAALAALGDRRRPPGATIRTQPMHKRKRQRLAFVGIGLALVGIAAAIILTQLQEHLVFFHSPSQLREKPELSADRRLRIGGLVEDGSVEKAADGVVRFRITDLAETVPVTYRGILPDLFREGQGVVVEGRMQGGLFVADQVLAKHDENYMPPEVADALKKSGQWQHMREKMESAGQHVGRAVTAPAAASPPAAMAAPPPAGGSPQ